MSKHPIEAECLDTIRDHATARQAINSVVLDMDRLALLGTGPPLSLNQVSVELFSFLSERAALTLLDVIGFLERATNRELVALMYPALLDPKLRKDRRQGFNLVIAETERRGFPEGWYEGGWTGEEIDAWGRVEGSEI